MASKPLRQTRKSPRRDPAVTSKIMRAIRSRDGKAEMRLRKGLFAKGFRFRVNDASVYGKPDIVFRRERVAVFVDGDFWHGNAWRIRGFSSFDEPFKRWNRSEFWRRKIRRNMERDEEVNERLRADGWRVLRFWESELEKCNTKATRSVAAAVSRQRGRLG